MNRLKVSVVLIALSVLAAIQCAAASAGADAIPPAPPVVSDATREIVWKAAIKAAINQEYWSALSQTEATWKFWASMAMIVGTVLSVCIPSIFYFVKSKLKIAGVEFASVIFLCISLGSFVSISASHEQISMLENRWQLLSKDWELLLDNQGQLSKEQVEDRIVILNKQADNIEANEPSETNHPAMHEAWKRVMHRNNLDEWAATVKPFPQPN